MAAPQSKYGGIPVEDAPAQSKYGGIPADEGSASTAPASAPQKQGFLSSMGEQLNPMPMLKSAYHGIVDPPSPEERSLLMSSGVPAPIQRLGRNLVAPAMEHLPKAGAALVGQKPGTAIDETLRSIPLIGPAAAGFTDKVSGQIGEGNYSGAAGTAMGFGLPLAAGGAISKGLGQLARAGAEPLAENALHIRKIDRAYGKRPGAAALDETTGIRPGSVSDQAQAKLNALTPQVDAAAASSPNPFPLGPARGDLQAASQKAMGRNASKTVEQLKPLQSHLATDLETGSALPADVPMAKGLELQRGFGDEFVHNWNPETMRGVKGTAARVYHKLGEGFDPEISDLRSREAGLIPVAQRGASTELNAGLGQRVLGRIGAHTGALTGAALGAHFGGLPGGLAGLVIPEVMASPTAQMIGARGLDVLGKGLRSPLGKRAAQSVPYLSRRDEENAR